jgi:hypothetical protein
MLFSSNFILSRRLVGHVAQVGFLRSPLDAMAGTSKAKTRFALLPGHAMTLDQ